MVHRTAGMWDSLFQCFHRSSDFDSAEFGVGVNAGRGEVSWQFGSILVLNGFATLGNWDQRFDVKGGVRDDVDFDLDEGKEEEYSSVLILEPQRIGFPPAKEGFVQNWLLRMSMARRKKYDSKQRLDFLLKLMLGGNDTQS